MAALERVWGRALTMALFACGSLATPSYAETPAVEAEESAEETAATGDLDEVIAAGEQEYLMNCRTCHGSRGTAGVPLANNEKVMYDYGYLAWAITPGRATCPPLTRRLATSRSPRSRPSS
jgi:mono/diheme cytochrome c family protein